MGYQVRPLKDKKSEPKWKLQYVSCKKADRKPESKAKNPKTTWNISIWMGHSTIHRTWRSYKDKLIFHI